VPQAVSLKIMNISTAFAL